MAGRPKKKGTSGQAKNFITRTQAVRKLQISLPDFRRLCIFKGIYPREPRNKKKASKSSTPSTTFYYTKDIQYLLHEPLLAKFRDHKSLAKKIGRALGRGQVSDAARLEKNLTPRITLDHIIKERYPTFVDALRDLDDALSMLFLFANLPSTQNIPPKTIALCKRLCLEFQHYLIVSHSLRKSFLSIKGIYYQATIQGQDILWLVPYKFVQRVTGDIDFRIMGTFVEFYTTLLGFVNYRLYTSVGLIYPPKFNVISEEQGAELGAFTLEGRDISSLPGQIQAPSTAAATTEELAEATTRAQVLADSLSHKEQNADSAPTDKPNTANEPQDDPMPIDQDLETETTAIDTFHPTSTDADTLPQPSLSANEAATLFSPFVFFLSRETPRQPLEFLLKAYGCRRVGWDTLLGPGAWTGNELDPAITHQIVDRPPYQPAPDPAVDGDAAMSVAASRGGRVPGRIYVQPQWVWDCVNARKLLRPDLYAPGATLPPHLSPWVRPTAGRGTYDPTAPLDDDGEAALVLENGGMDVDGEKDPDVVDGVESVKAIADLDGSIVDVEEEEEDEDEQVDDEEDEDEEDDDVDDMDEKADPDTNSSVATTAAKPINPSDDFTGFSSDEEDTTASTYQNELLAEALGTSAPTSKINATSTARTPQQKQAAREKKRKEEEFERAQGMLSRKKRKLLGKMMYGNKKREEEAERLMGKRRRLEMEKGR